MSKYFFTFFLVFVIYGCTSRHEAVIPTVSINFNDTVFLNNTPCFAPCWQDLRIGISTQNEVIAAISKFHFVNKNEIRTNPQLVVDFDTENMVDGAVIAISCINRLKPCIAITIANDKLRDIYIKLDNGLLINQVVERFGSPDYVKSHYIGSGEITDCRTEIIWVEQQIILYSTFFTTEEEIYINCGLVDEIGVIAANLEILDVRFLPLEDIKERITRLSPKEFTGMK